MDLILNILFYFFMIGLILNIVLYFSNLKLYGLYNKIYKDINSF